MRSLLFQVVVVVVLICIVLADVLSLVHANRTHR